MTQVKTYFNTSFLTRLSFDPSADGRMTQANGLKIYSHNGLRKRNRELQFRMIGGINIYLLFAEFCHLTKPYSNSQHPMGQSINWRKSK